MILPLLLPLLMCLSIDASQDHRYNSLMFPTSTIKQMDKHNISPVMISNAIQNGHRITGKQKYLSVYVCTQSMLGVLVHELTGKVGAIIPKMNVDEYWRHRDAHDRKKMIASRIK